ncbi:hypothetical protein MF406_13330 [Georgenia sp. TF02-10]|uniref:hypothetical protein n=1 Tax=Georgenia sp. TF02-10 TaxID=2917725 RepID=UPI001FA7414B|nr:hypothetical protein [Georgenia sp. TF02-10]UNX53941.1 hypothetical protein MF406_13330 [Georgenia sp. TF02-10]
MSTIARPDAVAKYAGAVRDHLRALDPETLDELTGGLEADLADALADEAAQDPALDLPALDIHDMTTRFGPAEAYADELRQAAGVDLPAAAPRWRRRVRDAAAGWRADVLEIAANHRWLAATLDVLGALRPVWWVARAWVVLCALQGIVGSRPVGVPNRFVDWVVLAVLVVLSTQWGRGRLGQGRFWHGVGRLTSLVTAVALPFLILAVPTGMQHALDRSSYEQGYADASASAGVPGYEDPREAAVAGPTNLFVFGPDGEPIDGAQIVDQDGRPFVLTDPTFGGAWDAGMLDDYLTTETDVPAGVVSGDVPLNVYPYRMIDADRTVWSDDGEPSPDLDLAEDPQWPAGSLFPVPGFALDGGNDTANPEDAATETPGDAPTTSPSGEPSP